MIIHPRVIIRPNTVTSAFGQWLEQAKHGPSKFEGLVMTWLLVYVCCLCFHVLFVCNQQTSSM